ncbi:MAG: MgtC/SapB family protein [Phycisphaerales bacterium JB040]
MDEPTQIALVRIGLAALLGGLTGIERDKSDKPAGVRTMLLIAAGSCAFALLGERITGRPDAPDSVRVDSTRVLSYLITGIGFLGGGAILHSRRSVRGLTTAATIWAVAGMGAACGLGEHDIALVIFAFVIGALWVPRLLVLSGVLREPSRGGD